ncbi:MAG: nitroreductase family protein [Candidatus Cloacimonetes bacterium]|nr:nitroreductase family protein [Candidatus Cloacimonadota bacterium]
MLKSLVLKNRSYRRFREDHPVTEDDLKSFIDVARLTPSAMNRQPLRYITVVSTEAREKLFPLLRWAGYLKDWPGPDAGERPAAYIIMLADHIGKYTICDAGIAAQTILLSAVEQGLGGCILGSVDRDKLRQAFSLSSALDILLVLALGKPGEKVIIERMHQDIKYWRDEEQVHHVPKYDLAEVIIASF